MNGESLNTYATLTAFRLRQGLTLSDTADDARLLAKLRAATAQIDRCTGRHCYPVSATHRFDYQNARALTFGPYSLLELTSLVNGDGSAVPLDALTLLGESPYYGVELDTSRAVFIYAGSKTAALTVTGIWGAHPDYARAWRPSADALTGALNSTATTLGVSNASGSDGWLLAPRFQPGQLLRIDSEYLHLVAVDTGTNTLTVVRGANGTTAASHSASTPISIYTPPADLAEITLRWAAWLLRLDDTGGFGSPNLPFLGGVRSPGAIPADLIALLDPYVAV